MSARARSYQRLPQAEVAALSTPAGSEVSAHIGSSFDDDDSDGDSDVDEPHDHDHDHEALKKKRRQRQRSQAAAAWSAKLHALVWIAAAATAAYGLDVFHVVVNDERVQRCGGGCGCSMTRRTCVESYCVRTCTFC